MTLLLTTSLGIACSSGGGGSSPSHAPTVLTITPTNGEAIESNGAGLLNENADGSGTHIELGTLSDNKNASGNAFYKLATDADGTNNADFEIIENILSYKGSNSGDHEATANKLILKIERYNSKADADNDGNPQIFEYVVNLKNLNDNSPILTVEAGEGIAILYDVSGTVGNLSSGTMTLTFDNIPLAGGSINIVATRTGSDGNAHASDMPELVATDQDGNLATTNSNIGEITIHYEFDNTNFIANLKTAFGNHPVLGSYFSDAALSGGSIAFFSDGSYTLTSDKISGLRVNEGTTGVIADFSSTDADGDLNNFEYSVSDETNFEITEDGKLSFKDAPSYDSAIPANNTRAITITVSDGTNNDTYDLNVEVIEVTE